MRVTRLDIHRLRRLQDVTLRPGPRLNLLVGDNGAGKTSVLEALHLMGYGRSFRGRVRDGVIRDGADALEVFVEWLEREPGRAPAIAPTPRHAVEATVRRAGLRHTGSGWTGRLDGRDVAHLGELCAALAVVTFDPGSHALVTGAAEPRRRYLDWGLFHVEPGFMPLWRRYSRALKQRNALLKARAAGAQLDAWDHELAEAGEPLADYRERYLGAVEPHLAELAGGFVPDIGDTSVDYLPGWRRDELPLIDALLLARDRDLAAGHTSAGPHRADWRFRFSALPGREALSRGQAKLVALAALLAQARHHAGATGEWPVFALDDLGSELDRRHQRRVLEWLVASGAQVFVTGTEPPPGLAALAGVPVTVFHVEHGSIGAELPPA